MPTEDDIISSASSVIKYYDDIIKRESKLEDFGSVVTKVGSCKTYPREADLKVMTLALDVLQNYPQFSHYKVFSERMYIRSIMSNDGKDYITKDEVISRVLDVIKCHPKVDCSKVTEESHFYNDLGLDKKERLLIAWGLEEEFKLPETPEVFDSSKIAIDSIYHRCIEMYTSFEDDIVSNTSYAINRVDDLIKSGNHGPEIGDKAFEIIENKLKDYPEFVRLKVLSRVLDVIQNYPQVDGDEVFDIRMYIRRMCWNYEDHKDDITRDDVMSRVLQVVKCYPRVDHSKVTKESHFHDDLGLDEDESGLVVRMLEMEFKLPPIPEDKTIDSCKVAIDYIYDHRSERVCYEEYLSLNGTVISDSESDWIEPSD